MSYTLAKYLKIGDTIELKRRFDNITLLIKVQMGAYIDVKKLLSDPEYAKRKLEKYEQDLADLKQDAQNIVDAIDILNLPENNEEEDDDED